VNGISKRTVGILFALAVGLVVTRPVLAHHGAAGLYDTSKAVMMKGTITKFEWTNPHNQIYFDVKDDKGNVVHWVVATEPPQVMLERGWTRRSLKEGDQVTVYAFVATNGRRWGTCKGSCCPTAKSCRRGSVLCETALCCQPLPWR
jgi:hypothetical protein